MRIGNNPNQIATAIETRSQRYWRFCRIEPPQYSRVIQANVKFRCKLRDLRAHTHTTHQAPKPHLSGLLSAQLWTNQEEQTCPNGCTRCPKSSSRQLILASKVTFDSSLLINSPFMSWWGPVRVRVWEVYAPQQNAMCHPEPNFTLIIAASSSNESPY